MPRKAGPERLSPAWGVWEGERGHAGPVIPRVKGGSDQARGQGKGEKDERAADGEAEGVDGDATEEA